jgi:hypothetical protein
VTGTTCPGPGDVTLRCAASADCPSGQVCCLEAQQSGGLAQCQSQCNGAQLCDPSAPSSGCPQGRQCRTDNGGGAPQLPGNIGVCGG